MQVSVQKLSPVLLEFDVQIDADRVSAELEKSYLELAKKAKIRGFRPGHAPRHVLTQLFGGRVAADVAQRLVDETFQEAVSGQKVHPISEPAIEANRVSPNQAFTYKARVEVLPEVTEVNWEGLTAKRPKLEVTAEEIDQQLERLRQQQSTLQPVTEARPLAEHDIITMDYTVEVNGRVIADAGSTGFVTELGSGRLLPELEGGLLGRAAGEAIAVEVPMPANHKHKKLKGKIATFKVTVTEVKTRVLPQLDDEFAKDVGEFETLGALRDRIKEDIEREKKEQAENQVAEQLVVELVKKNTLEVPPSLVRQQMQLTEREIMARARSMGGGAEKIGDELRAQVQADSEMKVRAGLLMAEIAKRNQVRIGDNEIEEALRELAEQSRQEVTRLRAEYKDPKKREMLIGMILENKVLELIQSKAVIEDLEAVQA